MERLINTNQMIINKRNQIYVTRKAFEKAKKEKNIKRASDLRRSIQRLEKDLNVAIVNLRNEGWK